MTTAFQAAIKYPLIWIINLQSPDESEPIVNKVHRKIKKMVRFTDWLRAHYETAYHYYLCKHQLWMISRQPYSGTKEHKKKGRYLMYLCEVSSL